MISKQILPDDTVYIIPEFVRANTIDDMIKVTVSQVIREDERGRFVEGFTSYYDKDKILNQQDYKGYVGYQCSNKDGSMVITEDGEKRVAVVNRHKVLLNEEDVRYELSLMFHASEDIYVKVPICGNIAFQSKKEAVLFSKKIRLGPCYLQMGGIYCSVNGAVVVFNRYTILQEEEYKDRHAKEDLFLHMCNKEIPAKENEFHMVYSKQFLLKPVRFLITPISQSQPV